MVHSEALERERQREKDKNPLLQLLDCSHSPVTRNLSHDDILRVCNHGLDGNLLIYCNRRKLYMRRQSSSCLEITLTKKVPFCNKPLQDETQSRELLILPCAPTWPVRLLLLPDSQAQQHEQRKMDFESKENLYIPIHNRATRVEQRRIQLIQCKEKSKQQGFQRSIFLRLESVTVDCTIPEASLEDGGTFAWMFRIHISSQQTV